MRLILIHLTVVVLHACNFTFLIKISSGRDLPKIRVSYENVDLVRLSVSHVMSCHVT